MYYSIFDTRNSFSIAPEEAVAKLEAQNKHMEVYNQGLQNGYNMAKGTASPAAFMLPSFSSPAAPGSASASTPV